MTWNSNDSRLAFLNANRKLNESTINDLAADGAINHQLPSLPVFKTTSEDLSGCTALHIATKHEDLDSIKTLLKNGADVTMKDARGMTALHRAVECERNSIDSHIHKLRGPVKDAVINALLSAHLDYDITENPRSSSGISHLHAACITNNVAAVEFFLRNGASPNETVDAASPILPGYTPLHFAARYCSAEVFRVLLDHGAKPHVEDHSKTTPLRALVQRNMDIADWMNLGKRERCGYLRKEYKSNEGMIEAVLEMSGEGWDDVTGLTRLHVACTLTDTAILERLLEDEATDVDEKMGNNSHFYASYTALHFAAHFNPTTVKLLMSRGASMLVPDVVNMTPWDICLRRYKPKVLRDLLESHDEWRHIKFSDYKTKLVTFMEAMESAEKFERFVNESLENANVYLPCDSPIFPGYTPMHFAVVAPARIKSIDDLVKDTLYVTKSDESDVYNCDEEEADLHTRRIETLLREDIDFNLADRHESTALHLAFSLQRDEAALKMAIKYGVTETCDRVNRYDHEGLSHFQIACATGVQKLAECLFCDNWKECTEDCLLPDDYHYGGALLAGSSTPLHVAVATRNLKLVKFFLKKADFDIYEPDVDGMTPIHRAFIVKDKEICNALMKWKIETLEDREEDCGLTHLHVACAVNNKKAVAALLKNGADLEAKVGMLYDDDESLRGLTPLQIAIKERSREVVRMLIRRGANVFHGQVGLVNELYECYPDLFFEALERHVSEDVGLTELHVACFILDVDRVKKSLDEGADPNARISSAHEIWPNYTPLHLLAKECRRRKYMVDRANSIVNMMINCGADVMLTVGDGETPIHLAYNDMCQDEDLENGDFFVPKAYKSLKEGVPMPKRLEQLLKMPPACEEAQLRHGWNPEDKSKHIDIEKDDPLTIYRQPVANSTDAIRGKVGYTKGLHVWDIYWSQKNRGTHAVVGVATAEAPLQATGYLNLLGNDKSSCGWDIKENVLVYGADYDGDTYPGYLDDATDRPLKKRLKGSTDFSVPDRIRVILDMDEGTLAYMVGGKYLGVAFEGLKGMTIFPCVSVVWGHARITMEYIGGVEDEATPPSFISTLLGGHNDFNVNPSDPKGISTFHIACLCNNESIVEEFLKNGINVDRPISHFSDVYAGYTPLHLAAHHKFSEVVDLLIEYRADINARDRDGNTPLHCAADYSANGLEKTDSEKVLISLYRAGADIKVTNKFGQTPVELLMETKGVTDKTAGRFLQNQLHVNTFNAFNAGYIAAAISRVSSFEDVAKHPVYAAVINNPEENGPDDMGRTPIHNIVSLRLPGEETKSATKKYVVAIEGLMRVKFDVDQYDHEGQTPLHYAVKFQNIVAIRALLTLGADFGVVDIDGETPYSLGWKLRKENTKMMKIFVRHVYRLKLAGLEIGEVNEEVYNQWRKGNKVDYEEGNCDWEKLGHVEDGIGFSMREFLSNENAVTMYQDMDEKAREIFDKWFEIGDRELTTRYSNFDGLLRMQYRKVRAKAILPMKNTEDGSYFSSLYSYLSWS